MQENLVQPKLAEMFFELVQLCILPVRALNVAIGGSHLRLLSVLYIFVSIVVFKSFMHLPLRPGLRILYFIKPASVLISTYITVAMGFFLLSYILCAAGSC